MRIYSKETKAQIIGIKCNSCGKELRIENGVVKEGVLSVTEQFGYFSKKDGQIHSFDLCENCYDKMKERFQIPVDITESRELV